MTDDLHSASAVIGGITINDIVRDADGHISRCSGASALTGGLLGFAGGCEFYLDLGTTFRVYVNEGDHTSCDFNLSETADNDSGVTVYNNLGSLAKGVLVNLTGFSGTAGLTMVKADADAGIRATHVVRDVIADLTVGVVYPFAVVDGLATNGQTIGDAVYVSATAGGFTFSAPTGADQMVQKVGVVKIVHASAGEISFFPNDNQISKIPTSMYQALSVDAAALANGAVTTAKVADSSVTAKKVAEVTTATATADGLTTGSILALLGFKKFVAVTSANATDAITLPGANVDTIGQEIFLSVGANGFELLVPAASNATINLVDGDGTNQLDVAANTTVRCTQVGAAAWLAETIAATSIAITAPDND